MTKARQGKPTRRFFESPLLLSPFPGVVLLFELLRVTSRAFAVKNNKEGERLANKWKNGIIPGSGWRR